MAFCYFVMKCSQTLHCLLFQLLLHLKFQLVFEARWFYQMPLCSLCIDSIENNPATHRESPSPTANHRSLLFMTLALHETNKQFCFYIQTHSSRWWLWMMEGLFINKELLPFFKSNTSCRDVLRRELFSPQVDDQCRVWFITAGPVSWTL